ncbi:MAG: regulatory protein RecX, partial [Patescibacteria group bacterium]|nr:regulatory protein RecX [Patescibacteria group bacterium]
MDEKLYIYALKYLTKRSRSEKEVRDNLSKRKAGTAQIEIIIAKLKEQRFLDDKTFALWWIEQRQLLRPLGWRVLELELKQKGIAMHIIDEIKEANKDLRVAKEFSQAMELAGKRYKKFQGLPKDEVYHKIGGFLARRG